MKEILYLVMLAGATGSFIHSAGSFINYVGNEQLKITWFWWYLLRPFLGIAVAVIFFVLFYSGYLKEIETTDSPYGFLAFCTLAGTFSDLATLKLKEIFEALFNPRDKRADKLSGSKKDTDFEESNAQG